MSQGRKARPESALFVPAGEIRAQTAKSQFYKQLGALLDLSFAYELTKPLYAERMGRPSLDPVVFFKCMLIGFFENIVYDTELEFRISDSLTFRDFLGYELDKRTPDESTLRKTRQRMPEEVFDRVFGYVLDMCERYNLLRGRALGTDSSLVDANASMESLVHKELGCSYEEYMVALRRQDSPDATREEAIQHDKCRKGKASNLEWESATDPESRVMQHADGHTHLSYKVDASVDLETGVIVTAGADLANVSDQCDCLERVDEAQGALEERGLSAIAIVADKGHHSGENLVGIEGRGLIPLISSPNHSRGAPGFRREDFRYNPETDILICPAGQILTRLSRKDKTARHYKAKGSVCRSCPSFGVCTKNMRGRAVSISVYEDVVRANWERVHSEEARPLMQIRRQRGEAPFGYFKQFGGLRRFAGRGLEYAVKKTLIAALGWNLLILVKALTRNSEPNAPISAFVPLLLSLWTAVQTILTRNRTRDRRSCARSPVGLTRTLWKAALSGGC